MENNQKKHLTKQDALEKMCFDIRKIAKVVGYGKIWYPTMETPSIICTVHNGLVTQAEVLFINTSNKPDGTPIMPDRSAKYQSD